MAVKSSEFLVKFDGVKLPAEAEGRIAAAIQAAALNELARLDLAPTLLPQFPNRKLWYGIWIRNLKKLGLDDKLAIPQIEIKINARPGG
jgi:hypothetical protein